MEQLKELEQLQKIALNAGDFATLNTINQKIFEMREQARKEKAKQKQQEQDNNTHKKIENILTR